MRFLQVLGFATIALALPSPAPLDDTLAIADVEKRALEDGFFAELEARQTSGAIGTAFAAIVADLQSSTTANIAAIQSAAATIGNATSASVVVAATAVIRTNLRVIATAIGDATREIITATTGALGGVQGALAGLTQKEVDIFVSALQQLVALLQNIRASLNITENVSAAVAAAASAELSALRALINPLMLPVQGLAKAILVASASASLTITGLREATLGLVDVARQIVAAQ